jgi:hypothetical protein
LDFCLLGDQRLQRIDVAVVELARVERRGALLDQRGGESSSALSGLVAGIVLEVLLRRRTSSS